MKDDKRKSFFSTIPGILTGLAALIASLTGLYLALHQTSSYKKSPPIPPPQDTTTEDTRTPTEQPKAPSEKPIASLPEPEPPSTTAREPFQEVITSFYPKSSKAGNDIKLFIRLPEGETISMHIGKCYFQGRVVPKKVHEKESVVEVLIPGDAKGIGYFEVEYKGQRIRAKEPFTVEPAEIIPSFYPRSAKAGNWVKLRVVLPAGETISTHIGKIYFQGRILPRKVQGNLIEVLIPGDAEGVGYFEVDYKGQRIRVKDPFTVEPAARRG